MRDLTVANEFDIVRILDLAQIVHVQRFADSLALDELPDRRIGGSEDPDGDAARGVVLGNEPLIRSGDRVEEPHLVLLAVVVDVLERRIQRAVVEVYDVVRLLTIAVLRSLNQCSLVCQRIGPVASLFPVVCVIRETDDQLLARNVLHRSGEHAAIPIDRGDRPRLAAAAVFVVRHHYDEVAGR